MHTVGVVPYLNAVPLVADLGGRVRVVEAVPAELAGLLQEGKVVAALLPVAEAIRGVGDGFLGNYGIASDGPVESVLLFVPGGGAPETWPRRVVLDPASRTSVALLKCLLGRHWRIDAEYEVAGEAGPDPRAHAGKMTLAIGDRAMAHRKGWGGGVVDLGEAWKTWTGLPFLFAAWTARRCLDAVARGTLARTLDGAAASGLARREELARLHGPAHGLDPGDAARYLLHAIRFVVGPREREGFARFEAELKAQEGGVPAGRRSETVTR